MTISFIAARQPPANAAVVAYGLTSDSLDSASGGLSVDALNRLGFTGEVGQVEVLPAGDRLVAAVGLGAAAPVDVQDLRKASAALARAGARLGSGAQGIFALAPRLRPAAGAPEERAGALRRRLRRHPNSL